VRQAAADQFMPAEKTSARILELNRYLGDARASVELVKTVKDALGEIESVLHRMRKLSVQAAAEKVSPFERALAQKAVDNCITEIDQIAAATEIKVARLAGPLSPDPLNPLH
jgi:flagellin